jgi:hypothetical protein
MSEELHWTERMRGDRLVCRMKAARKRSAGITKPNQSGHMLYRSQYLARAHARAHTHTPHTYYTGLDGSHGTELAGNDGSGTLACTSTYDADRISMLSTHTTTHVFHRLEWRDRNCHSGYYAFKRDDQHYSGEGA